MNIYLPREDSFLLEKSVLKYSKGKIVLDMAAGSGIQAQAAIKSKASSVLASDINPKSISFMKNKHINSIKSNLFSNIKEKFDLIVCNPPYLPLDKRESKESALATTGGKNGDEFICKFLKQAKNHLTHNGIILFLVSSLTPKDRIDKIISKNKWIKKIIDNEKMDFETLQVWEIK